jgi:hypothetical protein
VFLYWGVISNDFHLHSDLKSLSPTEADVVKLYFAQFPLLNDKLERFKNKFLI